MPGWRCGGVREHVVVMALEGIERGGRSVCALSPRGGEDALPASPT